MVTRHLAYICAALFLLVTTVSCTNQGVGQHTSEQPSSSLEVFESEEPSLTARPVNNDIPKYNVPVKNVADSDILLTDVDIPQRISGKYSYLMYIIDDSHALMVTSREDDSSHWPPTSEIAYYNFVTGNLEEPLSDEDIYMYPVYADADYCVATTTTEEMVYRSGTLVLLNRKYCTSTTIFRYQPEDGLTGLHPNNIVIWDGQVYFDDFTFGATDSTLYAYDIERGELRVVRKHAMNPIIYKNEVWFFTQDQNGVYRLLQSESGDILENYHQIGDLVCSQDKLFTTCGMGEDSILGTSLIGVFEWNNGSAIAESRRGNALMELQANEDFLAWNTTMPHQPPCVYDVSEETLYEFKGDYAYAHCDYTFYLNGHVGLLYMAELDENDKRTGKEKYLLFRKC